MALRPGLVKRFLSTSIFPSQSSPAAIASASASASASPPSTTLFVSGLNKRTTSEKLQEAFSKFGEVVHARVVTDRASGYSKGFGFVNYATLEDAEKGMKGMDAQFLDGWVIFAEYARPRTPPGQSAYPETNQHIG
ncbi:organelle RRM domain-containing protein 2, mitochondrial-like [Castanea sativa]|uniref:organelle RRM domain-containing protein 2, mitochondrial-like n=1 Tax=Castanea sativa TaxID=21020 RepID=UPI003F64EE3E